MSKNSWMFITTLNRNNIDLRKSFFTNHFLMSDPTWFRPWIYSHSPADSKATTTASLNQNILSKRMNLTKEKNSCFHIMLLVLTWISRAPRSWVDGTTLQDYSVKGCQSIVKCSWDCTCSSYGKTKRKVVEQNY